MEKIKDRKTQEDWNKFYSLEILVDTPRLLEFSELEQNLIRKKVLIITGENGMGKTQLLSEEANTILKNGGHAILLPAHALLTSEPVKKQILSYLDLSLNFHEFLDILETIGEFGSKKVYIFIDAINESNNKEIWKTGLPILFREIEKFNYIKLAISFRSGYEDSVLDHIVKQKIDGYEIPKITHYGFQNDSIDAIREFLNFHSIPFYPSYFLQSKMTNPLFLTMFCKTYGGNEFDLYHVLEKFLEYSDKEAQKSAGLPADRLILNNLISEIAEFHLENETYTIDEHELLDLKFWNHYGMGTNKLSYLSSIMKSGVFLTFMHEGTEVYRFGYNLLEDFVYAKVTIGKFSTADDCKKYLRVNLLKIIDGEITNIRYIDTFIVITSLFFAKFGEECIDIIYDIKSEYDRYRILDDYVKSFSWRASKNINRDYFRKFVNENELDRDVVLGVLIENSVKQDNPLNAEFLHEILYVKPLNERDNLWTTYINGLGDEHERLFQLISFFDEGKKLDNSKEKTWLILLLFSWLLTSSNRLLRDKASKAMIELLKTDFSLCLPLLKKFELMNDPYVIQRLYGVVFGACTKNMDIKEVEFHDLVEYIYTAVFEKDMVYPDILLRDYAKLIIEYFLYKFPDHNTNIIESEIRPPYKSDPIPLVGKKEEEYDSGMDLIASSMAPEGADIMYGDFGRYVFASALNYFSDAATINAYNYSMSFIENDLGYRNDFFGEYDRQQQFYEYNRYNTNKVERIGKKYQWIAMYNILARVSDHYELSDRWNEGNAANQFDGAWNPYVRDFDPTLNNNFLNDPNRPTFMVKDNKGIDFIERNASREDIEKWVNNEDDNFFTRNSDILLLDETGAEWVALDYYDTIINADNELDSSQLYKAGSQDKWIMAKGYLVKKDEFESLRDDLVDKNFMGRWFPEGNENTYWLFNREFGWSLGYKALEKDIWLDYKVETGEVEIVKYPEFKIPIIDDIDDEVDEYSIENKKMEYEIPIRKLLAKVMRTSNHFLWEEQYDASQSESTAFDIPCGYLIDDLKLTQREYDGYYYDDNGELVVFYDRKNEKFNSPNKLLIRKKHLDKFLIKNDLIIFWECLGEKRFIIKEMRDQEWGEWSGLLYLTDEGIFGDVRKYNKEEPRSIN